MNWPSEGLSELPPPCQRLGEGLIAFSTPPSPLFPEQGAILPISERESSAREPIFSFSLSQQQPEGDTGWSVLGAPATTGRAWKQEAPARHCHRSPSCQSAQAMLTLPLRSVPLVHLPPIGSGEATQERWERSRLSLTWKGRRCRAAL